MSKITNATVGFKGLITHRTDSLTKWFHLPRIYLQNRRISNRYESDEQSCRHVQMRRDLSIKLGDPSLKATAAPLLYRHRWTAVRLVGLGGRRYLHDRVVSDLIPSRG